MEVLEKTHEDAVDKSKYYSHAAPRSTMKCATPNAAHCSRTSHIHSQTQRANERARHLPPPPILSPLPPETLPSLAVCGNLQICFVLFFYIFLRKTCTKSAWSGGSPTFLSSANKNPMSVACTHTHTHKHTSTHTHTHTHTRKCMRAHKFTHVHAYTLNSMSKKRKLTLSLSLSLPPPLPLPPSF